MLSGRGETFVDGSNCCFLIVSLAEDPREGGGIEEVITTFLFFGFGTKEKYGCRGERLLAAGVDCRC